MIKSVDKALNIISIISQNKEGCGVTELADLLELNKSSVHKLLSTLVSHGYIEQDDRSKKYRLGYIYLELSSILLESIDLRSQARVYLEELAELTNEVVHLVVYNQGEAVYIEKIEGNKTLRTHSRVGRRAPMHCTSVGKVILAFLPKEEILLFLEKNELTKHTENTITDKTKFIDELEKIRNQGYGTEIEENETGITCIAAPIFDNKGDITAAVSISGPTIRLTNEQLVKLRPIIVEVSKNISNRLGYFSN